MLSRAVGYAVTAMGHIAAAGGNPVLVGEIAEATGMPAPYLAKIINALARRGLVLTQRGVGGGVTLAKPATEISMYDVCVALDDPVVTPTCMLGTAECSDTRACPAHKFWSGCRTRVLDFLQTTRIADIASFESRRRWRYERPFDIIVEARNAAANTNPEHAHVPSGNGHTTNGNGNGHATNGHGHGHAINGHGNGHAHTPPIKGGKKPG